jgi:hypothetical protein
MPLAYPILDSGLKGRGSGRAKRPFLTEHERDPRLIAFGSE